MEYMQAGVEGSLNQRWSLDSSILGEQKCQGDELGFIRCILEGFPHWWWCSKVTWKPGGLKRWSNQIVDVDLDRLEIGRRRARMQVMYLGW